MPLEEAKSTQPFTSCSMDLITDLPPVDGYNSILVVVDRGNTKGAILIPTTKTLTQEGAGQLLLDNLHKWFGLPDKILSDRGPQFAAIAFRKLLKLLGIKLNLKQPIIHRLTELLNESINKLKPICWSIALLILQSGKTCYQLWNSPTTINDMQTEHTPLLNWCMVKPHWWFQLALKTPSFHPLQRR